MAPSRSSCVQYKETRVNIDWSKVQTVTVDVPSNYSTSTELVWSESNGHVEDPETVFARDNLASASSIHFRPLHRFPRAILWRVVDNGRALCLSPVDFSGPGAVAMGGKVQHVKIRFPAAIKDNSVGMADGGKGADELVVFVLLADKQVITLRLKPEFWSTTSSVRKRAPEWCRSYLPSSFTLNNPHFLTALDGQSCLVALQNGALVKLARTPGMVEVPDSPETKYVETSFNSSLLSTFKQLIPIVGSGGISAQTIISIAQWTDGEAVNSNRLWLTVSMNHALRVWSPNHASALFEGDLSNTLNGAPKHPMPSDPRQLISILDVKAPDTLFHAITLCPVSNTFNVWAARTKANTQQFARLENVYGDSLEATPPNNSAAWIIAQFGVNSTKNPTIFELWVLWKSNKFSSIQTIIMDLNQEPTSWKEPSVVAPATIHAFPNRGPDDIPSGSDDIADFWEEWILYPERFPDAVLETALKIYSQSFPPLRQQEDGGTLASKIASTLSASVQQPIDIRSESLSSQRQVLGTQWERFARLCAELDRQRHDAQSLAIDPYSHFVWVTYSDMLNLVRTLTETEFIKENMDSLERSDAHMKLILETVRGINLSSARLDTAKTSDAMWLVYCATKLMELLPQQFQDEFRAAIEAEVTQDAMFATLDRVEALFAKLEIAERVPEETLESVENFIADRVDDVYEAFRNAIDYLIYSKNHPSEAELTTFGEKVLVSGAQEVIHVDSQILTDLMFLLILLTSVGAPNGQTRPQRRASELIELFERYFKAAQELELLSWLAKKKLPEITEDSPEEILTRELSELVVSSSHIPQEKKHGPILQLLFSMEAIGPRFDGSHAQGFSLTTYIADFLAKVHTTDPDLQAMQVAILLLTQRGYELALDIMQFIPNNYWGTYLKGRIHLVNAQEELASMSFKRAAYGLSIPGTEPAPAGIEMIVHTDRELVENESLLGHGLARYYIHIVQLFAARKSAGYVLEFSTLGLGAFNTEEERRSSDEKYKSELLTTSFKSAIMVSSFDEAYHALTQLPPAEQKPSLTLLVEKMATQALSTRLLSYPFIGLHDLLEEVLEEECNKQFDIRSGPPYHQILYTWRVEHGDFKGAAAVLHERLLRIQNAEAGIRDPDARNITDAQLALLNVMHCLDKDDAWVFSEKRTDGQVPEVGAPSGAAKRTKLEGGASAVRCRTVVRKEDVHKDYLSELEKMRVLAKGGFYLE